MCTGSPCRRGNVKGEARCVHFHGPKPDRCLPCYLNVARLNPVRALPRTCACQLEVRVVTLP